jgi:TatD DNase family protein
MKNYILADTHAHINCLIKEAFDCILTSEEIKKSDQIISEAEKSMVKVFINVGTSLIESMNCITLAQTYSPMYATVGIHPNDCTETWYNDFKEIEALVAQKTDNKIVGIGECGIDRHYPDYNLERQYDAFRAHIELALRNDLALVIHSRDAYDETMKILDEYKKELKRTVMHCFSYDFAFANYCFERGFYLGIGGTITYPKNNTLRAIVSGMPLANLVLETDAPFLPPQQFRGQQNHPKYIALIAQYIAELRETTLNEIAEHTTHNALALFGINDVSIS